MFIGLVFFIGIWLYRVVLGSMLIHSVDFTYSNDYNPKKVTLLLYLGAMKGFRGDEGDYNASNYRYRDLHYLVARGDIENVRLYLRLGGDVNSYIPSSYKPETLLENTKYRNHKYHHLKSVIALLIKYGAK